MHKLAPLIKNIFLAFFMEFSFLAFKKYLQIKLTAIFFYQFVLNILYYKLYDFTDMKVCLYAGDMNLNRNHEKKYVEIQKIDFLRNKTVRTFL